MLEAPRLPGEKGSCSSRFKFKRTKCCWFHTTWWREHHHCMLNCWRSCFMQTLSETQTETVEIYKKITMPVDPITHFVAGGWVSKLQCFYNAPIMSSLNDLFVSIQMMSISYGASLAGAAGSTVTCPLEVVKTRLQVNTTRRKRGVCWQSYRYLLFSVSVNCGPECTASHKAIYPRNRNPWTTATHKNNRLCSAKTNVLPKVLICYPVCAGLSNYLCVSHCLFCTVTATFWAVSPLRLMKIHVNRVSVLDRWKEFLVLAKACYIILLQLFIYLW